jgi:hypothetical protein
MSAADYDFAVKRAMEIVYQARAATREIKEAAFLELARAEYQRRIYGG